MYVPRLRGSWPGCWLLWKGVIFQNDDALEETRERPSRSQSCYPGTDNDGLFPDERGHRNVFSNFPGETIGIETLQSYLSEQRMDIVQGDSGRVVGNTEVESSNLGLQLLK